MAQASELEGLKLKEVSKEPWTKKAIFGLLAPVTAAINLFNSGATVGSTCLTLLVAFIAYGEVFGKGVSWPVYALAVFCGLIHLTERNMKQKFEAPLLSNPQKDGR